MNDVERELRERFARTEARLTGPDFAPPTAPVEVLQRTRRRQVGVAIVGLVAAVVVVAASIAGATALIRSSERRVPAEPPSIAPAVACPLGSTPDEPGPVDQARPPGRTGPMTFDRDSHRIVVLAGEHRDEPARARLWTFDVCTNTWRRMGRGVPLSNEDDDPAMAYDPGSGRILVIGAGSVWAYDAGRDGWSRSDAPTTRGGALVVFDPLTGRFIVRDDPTAKMWSYDAGANAWLEIEQVGEIPPGPWQGCWARFLTYDPSVDRLVLYLGFCGTLGPSGPEGIWTGTATWEFDPRAGTWAEQSISTPALGYAWLPKVGYSYAYDEANERMVIHSWEDGLFAYDAAAHRWSTVSAYASEPPPLHPSDDVVYDPVNARVVVYGDGVWAFDLATEEWIQLLAPSET